MLSNKSEEEILKCLHQFYVDWLIWASEGGKAVKPFDRSAGLCTCIGEWTHHNGIRGAISLDMKSYMKDDFKSEGLDVLYPFGEKDYDIRWANETMHKCPKRFAFVYKMAKRHT